MQVDRGKRARLLREAWEKAANGAVAVVDCWEEITCNPCEEACRSGAIIIEGGISSQPSFDISKCDGCGRCVAVCPGMAVFMLDRSMGEGFALVTVPYEMPDAINTGDEAWAVGENGECLVKGRVIKVAGKRRPGQTMLVTIEVPDEWALKVRAVRGRRKVLEEPEELEDFEPAQDFVSCRCEEISYSSMREIIAKGDFHSLPALRRASRVGLGFCQGRFCQSMLRDQFLAQCPAERGEVESFRVRAPVRPVRLNRLGGEDG
jgi:Fe-S-cluster-containing hydrogenase component 2